jgi:hypothetical protein
MAACKSATPPAEENLPTAEMAATVIVSRTNASPSHWKVPPAPGNGWYE